MNQTIATFPPNDTGMTLTVLGSSASSPDAGNACAGYLVRQESSALLLDCGPGVLGNLRRFIQVGELNAIVISHFHPDHFLDLIPMRYGLRYGIAINEIVRPLVYVPPGGIEYLRGVGAALRDNPVFFEASFDLREFDPDAETAIGPFKLTFRRTTHDEPTWASAVQGAGRLVYTADTKVSGDLEQFASGADLLLCESTYPASSVANTAGGGHHLTSAQAGELGRRASVGQLMLTHFWPGIPLSVFAREAEGAFGGPVALASPGLVQPVVHPSGAGRTGSVPTLLEV